MDEATVAITGSVKQLMSPTTREFAVEPPFQLPTSFTKKHDISALSKADVVYHVWVSRCLQAGEIVPMDGYKASIVSLFFMARPSSVLLRNSERILFILFYKILEDITLILNLQTV